MRRKDFDLQVHNLNDWLIGLAKLSAVAHLMLIRFLLYENNRSGYYRLAAECQGLKVDVDAIKEIPDYEIQQMALDLTPLMSS